MLILYSALLIALIYLYFIYSVWRILVRDTALLGKYLSKKAFLAFYIGSQTQIKVLSRGLCIIISMLPLFAQTILLLLVGNDITSGDLTSIKQKYQLNTAMEFNILAIIVSWTARYIFCRLCLDKATILVKRVDPNFSLIVRYRLLGHRLLNSKLGVRLIFFWEKRLLVEHKVKGSPKKVGLWVYRVMCCYVSALISAKIRRTLFRSKKQLVFSNRISAVNFAEMLKIVSDCFDHSEFEVNVLRQARFGKTNKYLYQIAKENEAKQEVVA